MSRTGQKCFAPDWEARMQRSANGHFSGEIAVLICDSELQTGRLPTTIGGMSDVTRILSQIESGDPSAAEALLPLVYQELRKLAAAKLAHEKPGQTIQATALVHEAYLNLVGSGQPAKGWDSRGHFFAAAAEAMRRILIQNFRRKQAQKRGGGIRRLELADGELAVENPVLDVVALSDALDRLTTEDPDAAALAKLRIFAGLSVDEAGAALGLPHTSAYRQWTYAQAWLRSKLSDSD
jgi:RNA polymerase sigma factor (TIGR02999 family)